MLNHLYQSSGALNVLAAEDYLMFRTQILLDSPDQLSLQYIESFLSKEFIPEIRNFMNIMDKERYFLKDSYSRDLLMLASESCFALARTYFLLERYDETIQWVLIGAEISPCFDRGKAVLYDSLMYKSAVRSGQVVYSNLWERAYEISPDYDHKLEILREYTITKSEEG